MAETAVAVIFFCGRKKDFFFIFRLFFPFAAAGRGDLLSLSPSPFRFPFSPSKHHTEIKMEIFQREQQQRQVAVPWDVRGFFRLFCFFPEKREEERVEFIFPRRRKRKANGLFSSSFCFFKLSPLHPKTNSQRSLTCLGTVERRTP